MKKMIRVVGVFIVFIFIILTYSSLANLGILYINHKFNLDLNEFIRGLITTCTTFLLLFLTMWFTSKIESPRRTEFLTLMIDAMKQISKGDFNVKLNNQFKHAKNHPFGKFVEGINDMAVELNQMEQMRQEFISNVSHEIQSPLASINGFAKVLKRSELTLAEREHYLNIIETESLRLAHLSDNLLKLTSIESDHYPFEAETYRLDKQIRKIILSCEPQWTAKSLELDVSLDEIDIFADEELMNQVWINLINNSIKFTPNGGSLAIQLRQHDEAAEVTVVDTGLGICEEDQESIFERFYKSDKSRNRTPGGSGLGLSIAKKIIDMHEGTITVQSKLNEGTTFSITLPNKRAFKKL